MSKMSLLPATEYQLELATKFADFCVKTNSDEYAKRNQENRDKVISDIYFGKVAEYQVFNTLMVKGKKPSPPDIMIYEAKDKSFDADITCGLINVHVKSCQADSPFGVSWLFQPYDALIDHPSETDYLALCVLSDEPYMYLVKAADMEYSTPVKRNLDKKVIYENFAQTYVAMKEMKLI